MSNDRVSAGRNRASKWQPSANGSCLWSIMSQESSESKEWKTELSASKVMLTIDWNVWWVWDSWLMAQPLNMTGIMEHKISGKQYFADLFLMSGVSFNMTMLDCTQVLEKLYRFDVLDSASWITRPYSPDSAPSGFHLCPKLKVHIRGHQYVRETKARQRLRCGIVVSAHSSIVTDWRQFFNVGEGL